MIDISSVQAFDQELPGETKVLANLKSFFVNIFCAKVLCDAAVIGITEFNLVILMVKQVVNVYIVHIALDVFQVNVVLFCVSAACNGIFVLLSFLLFFVFVFAFIFICLFEPLMGQNLRNCESSLWF